MGIKLDISMETPLSDDDRDILAGISVMVLAIANRQNLVDQAEASAHTTGPSREGRACSCSRQPPTRPLSDRPLRSTPRAFMTRASCRSP